MPEYLPVDVYGRLARMIRLKGLPQSGAYLFNYKGKIDRDRLATALEYVVMAQHPVTGCRMARYMGLFYRWKKVPFIASEFFYGPFQELREFDLFREPPLRIHIGEGSIVFEMSHVAFDGVGLARLVRSLMEQYAALPEKLPATLDEEALRRSGTYWGEKPGKLARNPGRRFLDPEKGRVLSFRADPVCRTGEPQAMGTLLKHLVLPLPRVKEHARSLGCTVNDLFVAALLTQVSRWNRANGAHARFLSVDVPANLRPPDRPLELAANALGNFTINVTNPGEGSARLPEMVQKVSREFLQAKAENRQWAGIRKRSTLRYPTELVVILGRWLLSRLANRLHRFAPTAIVSNMGIFPGFEGEFAGVKLEYVGILGSAFSPLTLNTCGFNRQACILSFCVRRSHFRPDTLEQFSTETVSLILGED